MTPTPTLPLSPFCSDYCSSDLNKSRRLFSNPRYIPLLLFTSRCPSDYVGSRCQHPSPCSPSPCRNGGECRAVSHGNTFDFRCVCRPGFTDRLCLTPNNHACMSSPCRNGGTCDLMTLTTYRCRCPPGWSGMQIKILAHALFVHSLFPRCTTNHQDYDPCFIFKVKRANSPTHVLPIHVRTVASARPSIPPTSAPARPPSTVRPASKTSTSVPRPRLRVSTVACVLMRWAHTTADALKSTWANTVRPPTCLAAPHHARTEVPASRRETPPMTAAVSQVTHKNNWNSNFPAGVWRYTWLWWHFNTYFCSPIASVDLKTSLL